MEVKVGYKQTEVGIIPEDWKIEPLGELTTLMTNGFVGPVTRHYAENDDGVLYIQGYNVEENSFNFHGIKYVTEEFHRAHMRSCLRTGDLLTIQTGEVGLTTIVPDDLAGSNCHALIISRFDKKYTSPHYVSYYLNSKPGRARLRLIETGTTMKHLNVGDVLHFTIPLPPTIAEQEAIAEALSDADALIEAIEQLIAKKRQIKQGAMSELLTPPSAAGQAGKRRLAGFGGEWEVKPLGEIAEIVMGQSPSSAYYNKKGDGLPLIQGNADISNRETIKRVYTSQVTKLGKSGDVLMSVRAPVGEISRAIFDVCLGRGVCAIRYPNNYLYHYLIFKEPTWVKLSKGSTFDAVNSADVKAFPVEVPTDEKEQSAIAEILSDMDAEISALEAKLSKARQVKAGMMSELLTGKIRLVSK
jgi:type I restriction enzyme S subunit